GALAPGFEDGRLIRQSGAGRPVDLHCPRCLHCRPFVAGDHGDEVTFAHGLHEPVHLASRGLIDGSDTGAVMVGPDHASVQHVRQAEVVDVGELARDLAGYVHTRDRLADHLVFGVLLQRNLLVDLQLDAVADQLAVADTLRPRRIARRRGHCGADWPSPRAARSPTPPGRPGARGCCPAPPTGARGALAPARRNSEPPWKIVRLAAVSHWSGVVAVSPIT